MDDPRPERPRLRQIVCRCGMPVISWSSCRGDPSKEVNLDALFGLMLDARHRHFGIYRLVSKKYYVREIVPGDV